LEREERIRGKVRGEGVVVYFFYLDVLKYEREEKGVDVVSFCLVMECVEETNMEMIRREDKVHINL
jgi:hypothetical protein